tara:strand:+ start:34408 stop:36315 length:1908 start_codon:yes stop_codon:yes gene_type:complete
MKKILLVLILNIFTVAAYGSAICVPGVGYTMVGSVANINKSDETGLNSYLYESMGSNYKQNEAQTSLFDGTLSSEPSLHINLIPKPSLSSYMNLWQPGYCDVTNLGGSTSTVACSSYTTATTGSFLDILQKHANGHRTFYIGSGNKQQIVPIYMSSTKCQNVTLDSKGVSHTGNCFLGDQSLEPSMPYINTIDPNVYTENNYFTALIYKWNISNKGFIFSNGIGTASSIMLTTTSNQIPDKQNGILIKSDSNSNLYIPLLSASNDTYTNFDVDFVNYLSGAVNQFSFTDANLKLACNLGLFANDNKVNYCANIKVSENYYNSYYFNDVLDSSNLKQYLYNLIGCAGSNTDIIGCKAPTFLANYYIDSNFSTNANQYSMYNQSKSIQDYCLPSTAGTSSQQQCKLDVNGGTTAWSVPSFSDYTSATLSLFTKQLGVKSDKSTKEPALLLNSDYKNSTYSLSFVSDCSNPTTQDSATFDFSVFKANSSNLPTSDLYFSYISDGKYQGNYSDINLGCKSNIQGSDLSNKTSFNLSLSDLTGCTAPSSFSSINKIYLSNNYYENNEYGYQGNANSGLPLYQGHCAIAEPSVNSTGGIVFKFIPTGVCGLNTNVSNHLYNAQEKSESTPAYKQGSFLWGN